MFDEEEKFSTNFSQHMSIFTLSLLSLDVNTIDSLKNPSHVCKVESYVRVFHAHNENFTP
jgi:hypothetical protein